MGRALLAPGIHNRGARTARSAHVGAEVIAPPKLESSHVPESPSNGGNAVALWVTAHGINVVPRRVTGADADHGQHRSEACLCAFISPRTTFGPLAGTKEWETAPHAVRLATRAETLDTALGTIVVDTITGGMGRMRTVAPNGMISVEHPNGYTWKTCAIRAANSVERLNLLAADAAQASRFPLG